jgi:ribosomal protein S18 acetylase RimI-like enzyme
MFRIRDATVADADEVAKIHVSAWRTTYEALMPAEILANLNVAQRAQHWRGVAGADPAQLFVLEENGEVCGFCHIIAARDADTDETVGEITALYLKSSAAGRGYGRRLCEHALRTLKDRGFAEAVLWVLRDNRSARSFYERLGFGPDGAYKSLEVLKAAGVRYRIRL